MIRAFLAALAIVLLAAACGKVGAPLPPFIRIPVPVSDLSVSQSGYTMILTWTNPALYVDGSAATDLASVRIARNGVAALAVAAAGPGQTQSYEIPARDLIGVAQTLAVQAETERGRFSEWSNVVTFEPVDVPGPVQNLTALVDEHRIRVEWAPPALNPELADAYRVQRQDRPGETALVGETRFEDADYEAGATYTYTVTAARGPDGQTPGIGGPTVTIAAVDANPPQTPAGLEGVPTDAGVYLFWTASGAADLAGYRVYRSAGPESGFELLAQSSTNSYFDSGYRAGLYYAVAAVDVFGNESPRSGVWPAP